MVRNSREFVEELFSGVSESVSSSGGSLDSIEAREIMETEFVVVYRESSVREMLEVFRDNDLRGAPVVDDGSLVGVVRLQDIWTDLEEGCLGVSGELSKEAFGDVAAECARKQAKALMREPESVGHTDSVLDVLVVMDEHSLPLVPVEKGGKLVGVVRDRELFDLVITSLGG